jgi:hypothetical protein
VAQVLKLRTWFGGRQNSQVFKPEAQAKELAGIALESSFACASGFYYWGLLSFPQLNMKTSNFKTRAAGWFLFMSQD